MREIFTLNNRVSVNNNFATIRYVGHIEGQAGLWFGVEWDEPGKGKHQGTHQGVTYFAVSNPEKSASFVREKHMKRGLDFKEAVEQRYLPIGAIDDSPDIVNMFKMGGKDVQFISRSESGQSHISKTMPWNMSQPEIDLSGLPFQSIESDICDLSLAFPRVTCLNLGKTLVEDINVVIELLEQLPRVNEINLSLNQFRVKTLHNPNQVFPKVRKVFCDDVNFTFKEFLGLLKIFPNVELASYALNSATHLEFPEENSLNSLEEVCLQGNSIAKWAEINKLGHLPNLKRLNLLENKLPSVNIPPQSGLFECLELVILADNQLKAWEDFCQLSNLPALRSLVIRENPLCEVNPDRFREEVIARLPKLAMMNRSDVTSEERHSCEILYVKMYYNDWLKAGGSASCSDALKSRPSDEFLNLHPHYAETFHKVGDTVLPSKESSKPANISSQLMKVGVIARSKNGEEKKLSELKLLGSMSVSRVKMLIGRQLKLPANSFALKYRSHKMPDTEFDLDFELKELSFYSVENGDTIVAVRK